MEWTTDTLAAWHGTKEGRAVARAVTAALGAMPGVAWVGNLRPSVLGVGHVAPFAGAWPGAHVEEADWADVRSECRYDRIVVAHALETAERPEELLARCWRSLRPDGVLVVVAPHWLGWHRWRGGPLSAGRGFSHASLGQALRAAGFRPAGKAAARGMLVAAGHKEVLGAKAMKRNAKTGAMQPVPVGVAMLRGN